MDIRIELKTAAAGRASGFVSFTCARARRMSSRAFFRNGLVSVVALGLFLGAQCGGGMPAPRTFASGALIIPMDNCYQKRDGTVPSSTVNCNVAGDDGVFKAYGLVYFLLKHGLTVYWVIDQNKTSVTANDFTVTVGASPASRKWDWNSFSFGSLGATAQTNIRYIGGPFVIDAADAAMARSLMQTDPDFAQFRAGKTVDIHEAQAGFSVSSARPLRGVPPRIAILNIGGAAAGIMRAYAVSAGFDWPCTGANCAGGVAVPGACGCGAGATCNIGGTVNNGPGQVYDILCDSDFLPNLPSSSLGLNGYKLLWAPHWAGGSTPSSCTSTTCTGTLSAACALKCQLQTISAFVDTGNNLLGECHSIATFEGDIPSANCNGVEPGLSATQFQSSSGMCWNGNGATNITKPGHPNTQIGDYAFAPGGGSVKSFFPVPPSIYRTGVERLVVQTATPHDWDVLTTGNKDNNLTKGVVTYFGGHSYVGDSAGTRIVLNSMFNLGIPCADPNTACTTGQPGACGMGQLRCGPSGGFICVSSAQSQPEFCDGQDNDCNGLVDDLPAVNCYSADAGTAGVGVCQAGSRVCSGGQMSGCQGEVLPSAETCNGLDDDCNGTADDGLPSVSCYEGPPGTELVPPCQAGLQSCTNSMLGPCVGQVVPTAQASCSGGCAMGSTVACYDGPPSTRDAGVCHDGTRVCSGSSYGPCTGQTLPGAESCNGRDEDCDGVVDDGADCPPTYACVNGICVPTACQGELSTPCPVGYSCAPQNGCEPVTCGTHACAAGTVCSSGTCVDPCTGVSCGLGTTCSGGVCVGVGCYASGCPHPQLCLHGSCVADPCEAQSCPAGTFCRAGDCVRMCLYVSCSAGQHCGRDGFCERDCTPACSAGQLCVDGSCVTDLCSGLGCGRGQVCRSGTCVDDPCIAAHCPVGACSDGQCVFDGGTGTGAGGGAGAGGNGGGSGGGVSIAKPCGCEAGGAELGFAALALMLAGRRRRGARA